MTDSKRNRYTQCQRYVFCKCYGMQISHSDEKFQVNEDMYTEYVK